MEGYTFVIDPPPTPNATNACEVGQAFREYYEDAIAKTWGQHFHTVHWKTFNAFNMTCLIKERAACDWEEAMQATSKHFPELFAEYWMQLPLDGLDLGLPVKQKKRGKKKS